MGRWDRLTALAFGLALSLASGPATAQTVAIEPRFEAVGHFHEGLAPAREGGRWGFIDRTGAWVVPPRYDGVRRGGDGRFGIQQGGLWGYIDSSGAVAIEPRYEDAGDFADGVAPVKLGGKWGYVTPTGGVETDFIFDEVAGREGRIFPARGGDGEESHRWRMMRSTPGREPIISRYDAYADPAVTLWDRDLRANVYPSRIHGLSEGVAVAVYDKGETLVDAQGGTVIWGEGGPFFRSIRQRSEGWAAASRREGSWGYILDDGKFWDPGVLTAAREFAEGVAPVEYRGKWGYINKEGNWAMQPSFDRAYSFHQGYATMRVGEQRGFLRIVDGVVSIYVSPRYEDVFRFQNGLAPIKLGGRWGFLSNGEGVAAEDTRAVVDIIPE